MAEELEKSLSVVIPTFRGAELVGHYLPQLCAHIEECDGVDRYEVVVCDRGENTASEEDLLNLPNVVYLHHGPAMGEVESLNKGLYISGLNYVLFTEDDMLPTHNYFSELLSLFRYVPSLFGVSGTMLHTHAQRADGPQTIDANRSGYVLKTLVPTSKKPTYTLSLSLRNMLFQRKQICMMGGLSDLHVRTDFAVADLCFRAWRMGRKCLFSPSAYCKKISADTLPSEDNQTDNLRLNNELADQLLLDFMHSSRFSHFLFWFRLLLNNVRLLAVNNSSCKARKKTYKQFFVNYWRKYRRVRQWNKKLRMEPLDRVVAGYFAGPQLQVLSITE